MDIEIILRLLLAALWGGIVGAEREYRSKTAGFRTMIMISLGSCIFTEMSIELGTDAIHDRIASNIVTGVGFLGAGVIFLERNRVSGITTAATIWAVAAIGMCIGAGQYFMAASSSVLTVIVLGLLPYVERLLERLNVSRTYFVITSDTNNRAAEYEDKIRALGLNFTRVSFIKEGDVYSFTWQVYGHARSHQQLIDVLEKDDTIKRVSY